MDKTLSWLIEEDDPGVRYLALRDLLDVPHDDHEMVSARRAAHRDGPIAHIMDNIHPDGYWVKPGPGYNPKYRSLVWSIILLAQLGADPAEDNRIKQAANYLMDQSLTDEGQFTTSGSPSGTIDCLQGNLCWSLLEMGVDDPRLDRAFDWMARSVTGEGISASGGKDPGLRYYAYKCGPNFACGVNDRQACAWGAVKVMLALGKLPDPKRTPMVDQAIQTGIDFLFSVKPEEANYPTTYNEKPSRNWWKFGFPLFYVTDLLQNVEALAAAGLGCDPRLSGAIQLIKDKRDQNDKWALDYDYKSKTWVDFGQKKQPNKWVTLRALRVLKACDPSNRL